MAILNDLIVSGPSTLLSNVNLKGNLTVNGTITGSLSGNASTASSAYALCADATMKLYAQASNEINFGGTSNSNTIYFGYRAVDSKPIPTKFVFGGSSGTAELVAAKFTGALNGNASTASSAAKLTTARTISLTGDVSGSGSFDGSGNLSISATVADDSHSHTTLKGIYTGSGGAQPPSYIGANAVKCNMMNQFTGTGIGFSSYADVLMMNAYSWSDVPYATALAIQKTNGVPRAWIAAGGNTSSWAGATELITANNIGSYAPPLYSVTQTDPGAGSSLATNKLCIVYS